MSEIRNQELIEYFFYRGCTLEELEMILKIFPHLATMSLEEIEQKVTLLFNADIFYGIILCHQNQCQYYLLNTDYLTSNKAVSESFIIKTIIECVNKQYLQSILDIQSDDTLEKKLFKMRQVPFNSQGYRIK